MEKSLIRQWLSDVPRLQASFGSWTISSFLLTPFMQCLTRLIFPSYFFPYGLLVGSFLSSSFFFSDLCINPGYQHPPVAKINQSSNNFFFHFLCHIGHDQPTRGCWWEHTGKSHVLGWGEGGRDIHVGWWWNRWKIGRYPGGSPVEDDGNLWGNVSGAWDYLGRT